MKIIIPTKGRAEVIGDTALRLFPDATLCVGADEADACDRLSRNLLPRFQNRGSLPLVDR